MSNEGDGRAGGFYCVFLLDTIASVRSILLLLLLLLLLFYL